MLNECLTYHLTCDIRSSSKSNVLYGKQGEQVTILGDHGEVLTVMGECGTFPVRREFMTTDQVELTEQVAFVPQKTPTKKASKKSIQSPVTLF